MIVGGPNDSTFSNRGSVYVYRKIVDSSTVSTTRYVYQQTLAPGDDSEQKDDSGNQGMQFGDNVVISNDGNTIVVGAKLYDDSSITDSGRIFVYRKLNDSFKKIEEFGPDIATDETRLDLI